MATVQISARVDPALKKALEDVEDLRKIRHEPTRPLSEVLAPALGIRRRLPDPSRTLPGPLQRRREPTRHPDPEDRAPEGRLSMTDQRAGEQAPARRRRRWLP